MFLFPNPYTSHPVHFAEAPTWTSDNRITFSTANDLSTSRSSGGIPASSKLGQTLIDLGNASNPQPLTTATLPPNLTSMQHQASGSVAQLLVQDQKPVLGFPETANLNLSTASFSANSAKERCKTCGDEILPGDLIQHMRNHMGPRRCEICNYEAPTKHHLREHMNTHTGLKPYKCNFCEKCFAAKNSLRVHTMYLHTKVRAHQCHHCDQRFVTTSERKSHELVHTDKCPICQMTFRLRGHLRQHMKVHANISFHHKKR